MSTDNPNSTERAADDVLPVAEPHDDEYRRQDGSGAGDFAAEVMVNGAQMVIDGVGHVLSSVVSSLGDIG